MLILAPIVRPHAKGFSLVEVLIVMVILAVLLGKGVPAFQETLASMRVRDTAESIQLGLRLAQGEAIRRNRTVFFQLVNGEASNQCAMAYAQAGSGSPFAWADVNAVGSWVVSLTDVTAGTSKCAASVNPDAVAGSGDAGILQSAPTSSKSKVQVKVAAHAVDPSSSSTSYPMPIGYITFNGVGAAVGYCPGDCPSDATGATIASTRNPVKVYVASATGQPAGRVLELCVSSGSVKMCDPNLDSDPANPDPMACATVSTGKASDPNNTYANEDWTRC